MSSTNTLEIKAVIGLGNPGRQYAGTRHNIGFKVVDVLCTRCGGQWREQGNMERAEVQIGGKKIVLVKPQTFMNSSGAVIAQLQKQGINTENILVVHDELELSLGTIKIRVGGSAKGHNGLRSLIERCGEQFARLRFGIGRPERREDVPNYVLQNFSEDSHEISRLIDQAADCVEQTIVGS